MDRVGRWARTRRVPSPEQLKAMEEIRGERRTAFNAAYSSARGRLFDQSAHTVMQLFETRKKFHLMSRIDADVSLALVYAQHFGEDKRYRRLIGPWEQVMGPLPQ